MCVLVELSFSLAKKIVCTNILKEQYCIICIEGRKENEENKSEKILIL
jgi:hypothetical protein